MKNPVTLTRRQARDAGRVRTMIDMPVRLKTRLDEEAAGLGTSMSQLGTYLLAFALRQLAEEPELREEIQSARSYARTPRVEYKPHDSQGLLTDIATGQGSGFTNHC